MTSTNQTTTLYADLSYLSMRVIADDDATRLSNRVTRITAALAALAIVAAFLGLVVRRDKFPYVHRPQLLISFGFVSMGTMAVNTALMAASSIDCFVHKGLTYLFFPLYACSFIMYTFQGVWWQASAAAFARVQRKEDRELASIINHLGDGAEHRRAGADDVNDKDRVSGMDRFVLAHPNWGSTPRLAVVTLVLTLFNAAVFFVVVVLSGTNRFGVGLVNWVTVSARLNPAVCTVTGEAYVYLFLLVEVIASASFIIYIYRNVLRGQKDRLRLSIEIKLPIIYWAAAYTVFMVIDQLGSEFHSVPSTSANLFHALVILIPMLNDLRLETEVKNRQGKRRLVRSARKKELLPVDDEKKTVEGAKGSLGKSPKRVKHSKSPRKSPSTPRRGNGRKSGSKTPGTKTPPRGPTLEPSKKLSSKEQMRKSEALKEKLDEKRPGGKLEKRLREDPEFAINFRQYCTETLQLASLLYAELAGAYKTLLRAKNQQAANAVLDRMLQLFCSPESPMKNDLNHSLVAAIQAVDAAQANVGQKASAPIRLAAALASLDNSRWSLLSEIEDRVLPRFLASSLDDMDLESGTAGSTTAISDSGSDHYASSGRILSQAGEDSSAGTGGAYGEVPSEDLSIAYENEYDHLPTEMRSQAVLPRAASVHRKKRLQQKRGRRSSASSRPITPRRRYAQVPAPVADESPVCEDCERPAAEWCEDCAFNYCRKCSMWRHRKGAFSDHHRNDFPAVEEIATAAALAEDSLCDDCELNTAVRNCQQCSLSLCSTCDVDIHRGKLRSHLPSGGLKHAEGALSSHYAAHPSVPSQAVSEENYMLAPPPMFTPDYSTQPIDIK